MSINPVTKKLGSLGLKYGKEGIKKLLKESEVEKAASGTATDFPTIECRDALLKWSRTEEFLDLFDRLKAGETLEINEYLRSFLATTDFYAAEETESDALKVLSNFLERVVEEIYKAEGGIVAVANRQEVLHAETRQDTHKVVEGAVEELSAQISKIQPASNRAEEEFRYQTERAIKQARLEITGLKDSFQRDEITRIEDQLKLDNSVILKGDPGTGKTGIGRSLAENATKDGKAVLFLDAKRFRRIKDEKELRDHFGAIEPLSIVIARLGRECGFRLIIDQLDNVIGLDVATVLVDLAKECSGLPGVEVIVIGRNRETHESEILERLAEDDFIELESYPLTKEQSEESLKELEIKDAPEKLVELGRNLLNLELIATIKIKQPSFDFSNILDDAALWDSYLNLLRRREEEGSDLSAAEQTVAEAVRLAKLVVSKEEQTFALESPLASSHRRLESWGIIVKEEGCIYRFQHEQFQDYLFASDAVAYLKMPQQVMSEINFLRNRNIFLWMTKIYAHRKSSRRKEFLRKALLNV
jgi:DNA replication protein DnaC